MATDPGFEKLPYVRRGDTDSGQPRPSVPDHELIRFIAKGAFGAVWLARNRSGSFCAVKIVFRANFKAENDYRREFEGLQKFMPVSRTHNDLIDVLLVGRNDEAAYFFCVMEIADDMLLGRQINPETYQATTLESRLSVEGPLPFSECLEIGLAMSKGLEHLNKHGLIHRDIKPSNIIFVNGAPKIADIGSVTEMAKTESFRGTPGFMDPDGPGTVQADIYSLGKVLYEISFGKDRQNFPSFPTQLQTFKEREGLLELNEIITKACDIRPRRYKTAAELHADLKLLRGGRSIKLRRASQRRLAIARRIFLMAAAGLALLLAVKKGCR